MKHVVKGTAYGVVLIAQGIGNGSNRLGYNAGYGYQGMFASGFSSGFYAPPVMAPPVAPAGIIMQMPTGPGGPLMFREF
jgi:hypothetical protein